MKLRRSPTLEIGEKIKAAKSQNKILWSLSTPILPSYNDILKTDPSWCRLTPPSGMPELIEYTKTALFNNWDQSKHNVIISAGAKAALFAILKTITVSGDNVLLPSPTWPSYFDICTIADCNPIEMPTSFANEFEIKLDEIEHKHLRTGVPNLLSDLFFALNKQPPNTLVEFTKSRALFMLIVLPGDPTLVSLRRATSN